MPKSQKIINIVFIGRGTYEKGGDILWDIIRETQQKNLPYQYHIFGEGEYFERITACNYNCVALYGKRPHAEVMQFLQQTADVVLMPSRFLETFGLVALESLVCKVPVIGFAKGAMKDFVHTDLTLDEKNPVESFFHILEKYALQGDFPLQNVDRFSRENWRKELAFLLKSHNKILLVHDYQDEIGGAEVYVQQLMKEMQNMNKQVELFALSGVHTKFSRIFFFVCSVFGSFFLRRALRRKIDEFEPDLIWSHSVLRAIGAGGMQAIKESGRQHYLMHHDVGLFSVQPSKVLQEQDIPTKLSLHNWMGSVHGFGKKIIAMIKFFLVLRIFRQVPAHTLHLYPSSWVGELCKKYNFEQHREFPHTYFE